MICQLTETQYTNLSHRAVNQDTYGAGFPKRDAGIGILDGGYTAIGVFVSVRLLLDSIPFDEFVLVFEAEFFEHDGDFPGIGTAFVGVKSDCL